MDGCDAADVPTTFVAVTVKVYDVPFESPVMMHDSPLVEHVFESGFDRTVYELAAPPLLAGRHAMSADAFPACTDSTVGACGADGGTFGTMLTVDE